MKIAQSAEGRTDSVNRDASKKKKSVKIV